MTDDLLSTVIEARNGQTLWNTLGGLTVDLSIGGPILAVKGWPGGASFEQTITHPGHRRRANRIFTVHPAGLADDV